jgi:hypothetical protein
VLSAVNLSASSLTVQWLTAGGRGVITHCRGDKVVASSIFLQFALPNSTSWFYLSFVIAITVFFQFTRPWALRNFDLLLLFLFAPGLLLVEQGGAEALLGEVASARRLRYAGYGWLLAASFVWFVRAQVDLLSFRRPLVAANLGVPALVWLAGALLATLVGLAFTGPGEPVGRQPAAVSGVQDGATALVTQGVAEGVSQGGVDSPGDLRFYVERSLAVACHVAVVVGLFFVGWKLVGDLPTGVAAAVLYLLLPYAAFHVGQVHHVWPAALVLWAVFWYRRPTVAGVLLGLAAGTAFFPILLLPAWLQFYRPRGTPRFLGGFAAAWLVGVAVTVAVLAGTGRFPDGMWQSLHLADWHPSRRSSSGRRPGTSASSSPRVRPC